MADGGEGGGGEGEVGGIPVGMLGGLQDALAMQAMGQLDGAGPGAGGGDPGPVVAQLDTPALAPADGGGGPAGAAGGSAGDAAWSGSSSTDRSGIAPPLPPGAGTDPRALLPGGYGGAPQTALPGDPMYPGPGQLELEQQAGPQGPGPGTVGGGGIPADFGTTRDWGGGPGAAAPPAPQVTPLPAAPAPPGTLQPGLFGPPNPLLQGIANQAANPPATPPGSPPVQKGNLAQMGTFGFGSQTPAQMNANPAWQDINKQIDRVLAQDPKATISPPPQALPQGTVSGTLADGMNGPGGPPPGLPGGGIGFDPQAFQAGGGAAVPPPAPPAPPPPARPPAGGGELPQVPAGELQQQEALKAAQQLLGNPQQLQGNNLMVPGAQQPIRVGPGFGGPLGQQQGFGGFGGAPPAGPLGAAVAAQANQGLVDPRYGTLTPAAMQAQMANLQAQLVQQRQQDQTPLVVDMPLQGRKRPLTPWPVPPFTRLL